MATPNNNATLKGKVVSGLFWRTADKFSTQFVAFFVSLVLARLLGPEPYGLVALLAIFISISNLLVDCGLAKSLIQRKTLSDADCSTMFWVNTAVGFFAYLALFFAAPAIAVFYRQPILVPVLRIAAIGVLFNAMNDVQNALLEREMKFRLGFWISMGGVIANGTTGLFLAFRGAGVWALVWAGFANSLVGTLLRWTLVGWRPSFVFSRQSFKSLFSFSWKLSVSSLFHLVFVHLSGLLIGRYYSPDQLAFYNKGRSIPNLAVSSINGTVVSVSFPALSKMQSDRNVFREAMRKMLIASSYFVVPGMSILAGCATPLVRVLLGDKWLEAVPFLKLACFTFAFLPFTSINLQAIVALGRTDITLKLEILKKAVALTVMALAIPHGVLTFAVASAVVTMPFAIVINTFPNKNLVGYGRSRQFLDAAPALIVSALILFSEVIIERFMPSTQPILTLFVQLFAGVAVFSMFGTIFHPRGWRMFLATVGSILGRIRRRVST